MKPLEPEAISLCSMSASMAPNVCWSDMGETEHFVQFYERDGALLEAVDGYVKNGLRAGATAIVIATRDHLDALERQWQQDSLDLAGARRNGQYIAFDAAETLARLLLDDWPHARRFADVIGSVIARACARSSRVIAFGEMVALLWKDGKQSAAIHLETLWNDLLKKHSFSLFCAYPMSECAELTHAAPFAGVCCAHTRVIPAESYSGLAHTGERLAQISQLQQKAQALENEVREHRAVQAALAHRERELQDFFDNALEGLHRVGPDGLIQWANKAELRLLGYTAEEYIGHPITQFHADPDVIREILRRLMDGEQLYDQPARLRCKDGSIKHVLIHSNARWEDGKFVHSRCFTRDVTERVLLEQEVQARLTQLSEMDRHKDEFLAMLGHELRNPLAAIRNLAELMRRMERGEDPKYRERCEMLTRQVQQMGRLVDDLLDASRITQGKITIQRTPLELMAIMARAIETCRPAINARAHHLTVMMPEEPIRILGDLTRLVQVFANILGNAAKYTPQGGHIRVSARELDGRVELRVRDDGVGIAPGLLPRVFDLFSQADQTLERSEGGLGIGLALVQRIVILHGGEVEAFSDGPGAGSEFVVRLPVCTEEVAQRKLTRAAVLIPSRKILVVDDNRDAARSLAELLSLDGHITATAFDAQEALRAVAANPPEVILLDIGLPGMNGYELAHRLRTAGSSARLVAVTGYGQPEDRERALRAGFHHHLSKPVDPQALDQVLA